MRNCHPNKGSVLIAALLLVVFIEVIFIAIVQHHQVEIRIVNNLISQSQNKHLFQGGLAWGVGQVRHILTGETNLASYTLPLTLLEDKLIIKAQLIDLQNRVNINDVNLENAQAFKNMLFSIDDRFAETFVDEIISVLGKDTKTSEDQSEQNVTQELAGIVSTTELLEITQLQNSAFGKISPFIYAAPESLPLNINTASVSSLIILDANMMHADAEQVIQYRGQIDGFKAIDQFSSLEVMQKYAIDTSKVTLLSTYYLLKCEIEQDEQFEVMYALLKGRKQGDKIYVSVLWQSYGTI